MLPNIISSMGPEGIQHLKKMAMFNKIAENSNFLNTLASSAAADNDDIPNLVENFENVAEGSSSDKGPTETVD